MSQTDQTTTRLSRERLLNLIYEAPQYNSGVVQIVDNVVALFNERDAYMTALERVKEWYSELSVEDYDKKYGPYAHAIPLNEWIDEVLP